MDLFPDLTVVSFSDSVVSRAFSKRHTHLVGIDRIQSSRAAIQVWDQLNRCDYKPGWSWRLDNLDGGHLYLIVEYPTTNTYSPNEPVSVRGKIEIPPYEVQYWSEERFMHWLAQRMVDLEIHESREWLRRDGALWDNPHAPGATR